MAKWSGMFLMSPRSEGLCGQGFSPRRQKQAAEMDFAPPPQCAIHPAPSRPMHFRPLLLIIAAAILTACGPQNKVDQAAAFAVLEKNMDAMQREDIAGVMATVHPQSPDFDATRTAIEELFAKFDFKYELRDLKVIKATPEEVKVSFVQKSTKVAGPAEIPTLLVEGVHTLRKDGGQWKMVKMVTIRTTTL
jgi:hypothetical protein